MAEQIRRDPIDLTKVIPEELRTKPEELVSHLSLLLFQRQPQDKDMRTFAQYVEARKPDTGDETMRGLLHLMMSTPEFQMT